MGMGRIRPHFFRDGVEIHQLGGSKFISGLCELL